MTMPELSPETESLIAELDAAVEAHMNWTRRILRCVVLKASPGEDVLDPLAHTLCRFGRWFASNRRRFEALDAAAAQQVDVVHQAMHDAIRSICSDVLGGQTGKPVHLDAFEQSQSELLALLAQFKTLILSSAVRQDPLTGVPMRYGIEHDFSLYQSDARRNRNLRGDEPLYRFGGEEFLWLMQCKSVEEAEQSAQRLLTTIRTTPVRLRED